ncbi:MAG: ABC transporter permease [Bdellovibrionota bacterium]
MKRIKKYCGLYWAFFRASLTADLEFRANFAMRIVTDIFWYVAQIMSFELLFNFTDHIGDWNRAEMRVFLGVLFVVDGITMVMFQINLDAMSEAVRKGTLDLLLSKPVNSQFMISLQRVSTAHLGNLLLALAWLLWACFSQPGFTWWRALWLILTIPTGVIIFYVFRFLFSAATVIFTAAGNLQYLFYHLYRLGMRPDTIYAPWLKYTVLTILPMGLIASVPARLLLGIGNPWLAPWALVAAMVGLWWSSKVWEFALRNYSSASS